MIIESLSALFHGVALFSGGVQVSNPSQAVFTKQLVDYGYVRCSIDVYDWDLLFNGFLDIRYQHYEYDDDNNITSYFNEPIFRFVLTEYGEQVPITYTYGYDCGQSNLSFSGVFTYETNDDLWNKSTQLTEMYTTDDYYNEVVFSPNLDSYPQPIAFHMDINFYFMDSNIFNAYFANVDNTYVKGYQDGLEKGYVEGYDSGLIDGNIQGQQSGYSQGYNVGYQNGKNDAPSDYGFMSLFSSIADTPIMMIYRMFNFQLFGTSMVVVVLTLVSVLILIKVLKKVLK